MPTNSAVPSPEATAPCAPGFKRCLEVIAVHMAFRRAISICVVAAANLVVTSSRIDAGSAPLVIKESASCAFVSAVKSTAVPGGGRRPIISKLSSTPLVRMRIKRSGKTFLATMVVAVAAATPPRSIPFCAVVATNGQAFPPVQPGTWSKQVRHVTAAVVGRQISKRNDPMRQWLMEKPYFDPPNQRRIVPSSPR